MQNASKKIALVTGANKGIGLEIARQLGRSEVIVLLGARNPELGRRAAEMLKQEGLDVFFLNLDVTNAKSIYDAAETIRADYGRLDILVNNAGISDSKDGPPESASVDAARRLMETNFFGALSVVQAMLPMLQSADAGRIVNVSSSLGSLTLNGDPSSAYYAARLIGYNASKAALNMLTVQLNEQLRGTSIVVNSACPGYVKTDINGGRGYLNPPEAAAIPVRLALLRDDRLRGAFIDAGGRIAW